MSRQGITKTDLTGILFHVAYLAEGLSGNNPKAYEAALRAYLDRIHTHSETLEIISGRHPNVVSQKIKSGQILNFLPNAGPRNIYLLSDLVLQNNATAEQAFCRAAVLLRGAAEYNASDNLNKKIELKNAAGDEIPAGKIQGLDKFVTDKNDEIVQLQAEKQKLFDTMVVQSILAQTNGFRYPNLFEALPEEIQDKLKLADPNHTTEYEKYASGWNRALSLGIAFSIALGVLVLVSGFYGEDFNPFGLYWEDSSGVQDEYSTLTTIFLAFAVAIVAGGFIGNWIDQKKGIGSDEKPLPTREQQMANAMSEKFTLDGSSSSVTAQTHILNQYGLRVHKEVAKDGAGEAPTPFKGMTATAK